uniref:MHYT domain-containing protein n=1 Tax=Fusarium oxysporum (strain Fo5176) TaxID=660025 RepID=A0A0D2YDJ0_FUSOF
MGGVAIWCMPAYVVGSAIIAVVASNVTLFMLFDFKATWTNSWRRRAISAAVLASAVSGMHWCAAAGTRYRFRDAELEGNELPKAATVIVAICLSLGACFVIAISTIIRIRNLRKSAFRAQQVTLGTTVFDKGGRILVDPDGLIPSTVITDSFFERLGNEYGEMIERYDIIFRELFCLAATELADRFHEDLTSSDQDAEWLMSAGYRFAELHQVSNIIRPGMQIQSTEFETKLRSTSAYANKHNEAPPGVHIGFFAIRASVRSGFDVLVQKDARNVLPSMALPLKTLDDWHLQLLKRFENMPVSKRLQSLNETSVRQSDQESEFAAQLSETIKTLCEWTQEPLF